MELKDKVFTELENGSATLVFTTENTARWWLAAYAAETGKSILAERAMAFDDFRALFAPHHPEKPADKYHRLAFSSAFISSGNTHLRYLYRDGLVENSGKFISFIAGIIPALNEAGEAKIKNTDLFNDLKIIKDEYSLFLRTNNLFEPGWEKHSAENFSTFKENRYILVGYSANINMQILMKELGKQDNISFLDAKPAGKPVFEKFSNEEAELEALFRRLDKLKKSGIAMSDIILTTPELDRLYPRLERKSREYSVPLSFVRGLKLSSTVPGQYLKAVERCIEEDFSFHSIENLLLNGSFPYKDMECNRRLVRFIIEHNIQGGSRNRKDDRILKALQRKNSDKSITELYRGITGMITAADRASDGDELVSALHTLATFLFTNREFSAGTKEDKDVYSFIIKEIIKFGKVLSETGMCSHGLFRLLISDLDRLSYVAQDRNDGIKVYSYGQDYLLTPPYRFIFALNDRNSRSEKKSPEFLEENEVSFRTVYNTTESLLDHYIATSENVSVSGAETTYAGAESPPGYFSNVSSSKFIFNPCDYLAEDRKYIAESIGSSGSFVPDGTDSEKLSYTAIERYTACPYKAFLGLSQLVDGKAENMCFEPAIQDDREIGSFLHSVAEEFMKNHTGQMLTEENLPEYCEEINRILNEKLDATTRFDTFTRECIRNCYSDSFRLLPEGLLKAPGYTGSFMPVGNEVELSDDSFTGKADTVLTDQEGKTILLDYKKGTKKPLTYQLLLYKRLYEELNKDSEVKNCFFYFMGEKNGSPFAGFDEDKEKELTVSLDRDIEATATGYKEGRWPTTSDPAECSGCGMKSICRTRFNLR